MNTSGKKIECPDTEYVSAYFDGELSSESAEFAHIKECPKCQKLIESYQLLADELKKELSVSVPENFADTIIAKVKTRNQQKPERDIFNFPIMLRVAALFVVIGFSLFLVSPQNSVKSEKLTKITPAPKFLNLDIPQHRMTTMKFPSTNRIHEENSIDLKDFYPTSTGSGHKISFVSDDSVEKPVIIPKNVKQVWVVKDLDSAISKFKKFAKNKNISNTKKEKKGNIEINLTLTKQQLVELVRRCHNAGFKLLSPTPPQPEQNIFAGNKDDIVNYQAILTQSI